MHRRKRKLIRFDMQLKVVLITLLVACLSLLIHFQLNMAGIWILNDKLQGGVNYAAVLENVRLLFINRFILAVVIAIPLATAIGIVFSFKFAGPIYSFKRHFREMLNGRWDQHVSLRRDDDLHDVSAAINEALDLLRARLASHQEIFKELEAFFSESGFAADGKSLERLSQLRQRLHSERAAFENRFPNAVSSSKLQLAPQSATAETVTA